MGQPTTWINEELSRQRPAPYIYVTQTRPRRPKGEGAEP